MDDRFARQLALPGWTSRQQQRLGTARALVVGCGGLGGPAALHLAAAGVGHVVLSDHDAVALSDLHRQVHFTETDVGRSKAEALAARIRALHAGVRVDAVGAATPATVRDLLAGASIVVDATDDQATHLLLNGACVAAGVPLVAAGLHQWEGHVTTVLPGGPCLRCLHPQPPAALSCAQAGIAGPLAGIVGAWQAAEALKVLLGLGRPLSGRMVVLDVADGTVDAFGFERRADCPACGPAGGKPLILDVRDRHEREAWSIPDSCHIPLAELPTRLDELPHDRPVLVHCVHGARAGRAVRLLASKGIKATVLAGARAWGQA